MRRGSETALWTAAFSGSVAVHAALAAAFALSPGAPQSERKETTIVFHAAPESAPQDAPAALLPAPLVAGGEVAATAEGASAEAAATAVPDRTAEAIDVASRAVEAVEDREAAAVDAALPLAGLPAGEAVAAAAQADAEAAGTAGTEAAAGVVDQPALPASPEAADEVAALIGADMTHASAAPPAVPASAAPPAPIGTMVAGTAGPEVVAGSVSGVGALALPVGEGSVAVAAGTGAVVPLVIAEPQGATAMPDRPAPVDTGRTAAVASPPAGAVAPSSAVPVEAVPAASPVSPGPVAGVAAPVPALPSTVPVVREQQVAAAPPLAPLVLSSRQTPAEAYSRLLDALSAEGGGSCFLALATLRDDEVGVDGFASEPERVDRLGGRLAQTIETPVDVRGHTVSTTQCAALSFAGGLGASPEASLAVELAATRVESGGELAGTVGNVARPWFYLLVVDHAGKVQEVDRARLRSAGPGAVGFAVPLTRMGDPVDTVQLLLAIASDEILEMVWLREGGRADGYFEDLREEIARSGGSVDFGVAAFMLR